MTLIDNAHTVLGARSNTRHAPNSVFLPDSNFFARNRLGFPFLHCCTGRSTCPTPTPKSCPGTHTLYWPALPLDYRCHAPRGRLGHALPPRLRACLAELSTDADAISSRLGVGNGSARLRKLAYRAKVRREQPEREPGLRPLPGPQTGPHPQASPQP